MPGRTLPRGGPDAPIGVFDSGVGGLTVVREVRALLPQEDIYYFADTAHCPYGDRPLAEVMELAAQVTEHLLEHGAKLIVVACNTASGAALQALRQRYPAVPFVGMVPAIKPACRLSPSGRVGVLATALTVQADLFSDVVHRFARDCRLTIQTCPGLAETIERGELSGERVLALLREYLAPLKAARVDVCVLGCTHYPLIRPLIEQELGPAVQVVESGAAVARQVERVLHERGLVAPHGRPGTFILAGSGDLNVVRRLAAELALLDPSFSRR
jgi:glutamate racemase